MLKRVQDDNTNMSTIHLKIITPQKITLEADVLSVTVPSAEGEITILPHHINLFSLLYEGIIKIKPEKYLAIGGGYVETDGDEVNILVSRAYGQDKIDAKATERAIEEAKQILEKTKNESERQKAILTLRRSLIDMKLIKRRKRQSP
ncbi:ATP synthase F1 subunit epsilon [Candidatus Roizmanbacteria bacterium RIFCSPHIGHO2_01_FULL_37_16b]|nr:MAG: ATP synthase F1 subunit epsilon [Candidatus Roizmanbacteria bacterium RIFCSPHIGHO2_01_FULL_37_16b]